MKKLIVFTPDGAAHTLSGFSSSMEYAHSYAYCSWANTWYKSWTFAGVQWMPINTYDVPAHCKAWLLLLNL